MYLRSAASRGTAACVSAGEIVGLQSPGAPSGLLIPHLGQLVPLLGKLMLAADFGRCLELRRHLHEEAADLTVLARELRKRRL